MRRTMTRRVAMTTSALLLGMLLAGPVHAADESVTIADLAFAPGTVTITEGDSVTWTNQDPVGHTATGSDFDTGPIGTGQSSTITFATAGTFAYVCTIHPQMQGQVVVEAAAPAPTATPEPTDAPAPTATAAPTDDGGTGGTTLTPAPTDTVPVTSSAATDLTTVVAVLLALLGASMLAGTWWFGRRGRAG